MIPEVQRTAG